MSDQAVLITKGIVAGIAVVLYVYHMNKKWVTMTSWGQKLRYYVLFCYALLAALATPEQIANHTPVGYAIYAAIVLNFFLIITLIVSIREDARHKT